MDKRAKVALSAIAAFLLAFLFCMALASKSFAAVSKMGADDKYAVQNMKRNWVRKGYKTNFYTEKKAKSEEKRIRKMKKYKKLSKKYSALARYNYSKKRYTIIRVDWNVTDEKKWIGKSTCGKKITYEYDWDESYSYYPEFMTKGCPVTSYFLMYPNGDVKNELWREDIVG